MLNTSVQGAKRLGAKLPGANWRKGETSSYHATPSAWILQNTKNHCKSTANHSKSQQITTDKPKI